MGCGVLFGYLFNYTYTYTAPPAVLYLAISPSLVVALSVYLFFSCVRYFIFALGCLCPKIFAVEIRPVVCVTSGSLSLAFASSSKPTQHSGTTADPRFCFGVLGDKWRDRSPFQSCVKSHECSTGFSKRLIEMTVPISRTRSCLWI